MAIPKGTHFVITANLTSNGASVYRRQDRTWSTNLQEAQCVADEAQRDAILAAAAAEQRVVCDPYAFAVRIIGGLIDPLTSREAIRANGPTVSYRRPDKAA